MKNMLTLAAVILMNIGYTSDAFCATSPKKDLTVMVYVAAANSLDAAAELSLQKMVAVDMPGNVNFIVQIARSSNGTWGGWQTCRRLEIRKDLDYKSSYRMDIGHINSGSGDALTGFIDYCTSSFPAKKYGLIIWSHGDGWRFENFKPAVSGTELRNFDAVAVDEDSGDKMYMHQLSAAIAKCKEGFAKNKLAFIGFDACLMGMMEVWYELKDYADYGVGSEDIIDSSGWPYDKIIQSLDDPVIVNDSRKLSSAIVTQFGDMYAQLNTSYTLSAVDLARVGPLSNRLSALVPDLLKEPQTLVSSRSGITTPYDYQPYQSHLTESTFVNSSSVISSNQIISIPLKTLQVS